MIDDREIPFLRLDSHLDAGALQARREEIDRMAGRTGVPVAKYAALDRIASLFAGLVLAFVILALFAPWIATWLVRIF